MANKGGVNILNDEKEQNISDPFDIFSVPVIERDHVKSQIVHIQPSQPITDDGPIIFEYSSHGGMYVDGDFTELQGELEIINTDTNAKTTADDDIAVINMFPITQFNKIEVKLNDVIVSDSSSTNHAFKSYFDAKFSYNKSVKSEIMKSTEYYFEEKKTLIEAKALSEDSSGVFKEKHEIFVKAEDPVRFRTQLYLDVFNTHKYIPSDVSFVITFHRNTTDFALMGVNAKSGKYKIKIKKLALVIKKISPSTTVGLQHNAAYNKKFTAMIPFTQTVLTHRLMHRGAVQQNFSNVTLGNILPRQLYVFFVEHQSFSGHMEKNPFVFKPHNLKSIRFNVNGTMYPTTQYNLDFNKNDVMSAYMDFLHSIGTSNILVFSFLF